MIRITSRRLNGIPLQKAIAVLAIGFVVAACARTGYVGFDKGTASVSGVPLRTVAVEVDDAYYSNSGRWLRRGQIRRGRRRMRGD